MSSLSLNYSTPAKEIFMDTSLFKQCSLKLTVFRLGDLWVFDDPTWMVFDEPFAFGMSAILNAGLVLKTRSRNHKMFSLLISDTPIKKDSDIVLSFSHSENGGNWYWWNEAFMEGWLSSYFTKRFSQEFSSSSPKKLYFNIQNIQDEYSIIL